MTRKTYIYTLSDKFGVRYIGKSNEPNKRLIKHIRLSKFKKSIKDKWIFSLLLNNQYPVLEILEEVDEKKWESAEIYWIAQFKAWGFKIMNGTSGGEGSDGFKGRTHSEKTKKILSLKASIQDFTKTSGVKNGFAKLNQKQVEEIRSNVDLSYPKLAKLYGVSKNTIGRVKRKNTYK